MFSSLKIARLLGIDVFIHWSFWLLPLWVILTWGGQPHIMPMWMNLLLIGALFVCVVLHELGHAVAAKHFGIGTRSITLTPLGGIAQLERMSHKPAEEFCIAIAGPLVNVALAGLLGLLLLMAYIINANVIETLPGLFALVLLCLNMAMVVFNLIPAFPMDGGRVLRAILASALGLLQGTRVAVNVGTVVALIMGFAGIFLLGNPWLFLIALFVIFAGHQELRALEFEAHERHAAEEDGMPAMPLRRPRAIVHVWDPQRGEWIRRVSF